MSPFEKFCKGCATAYHIVQLALGCAMAVLFLNLIGSCAAGLAG